MILLFAAVLPLWAGCFQEPGPCVADEVAREVYAAARTLLDDPYDQNVTMHVHGSIKGVPTAMTVQAVPGHPGYRINGTDGAVPLDIRMVGPFYSFRLGDQTSLGRDHAPGAAREAFLGTRISDDAPGRLGAGFVFEDHEVSCMEADAAGHGPFVRFLHETNEVREELVAEAAWPHRPVYGATTDPVQGDAYEVLLEYGGAPIVVETDLPRVPARLRLIEADYKEEGGAFAFAWVVGDGDHVPLDELRVAVLDGNDTLVRLVELAPGTHEGGNLSYAYDDQGAVGFMDRGDKFHAAARQGNKIALWDAWARDYAAIDFVT